MRLPYSLRAAGARLVRHMPVRIRSGPNQGLKWSLASSGRGYRAGRFETGRIQALHALVSPGDQVWDIGAHKGYVAMALARRVGPTGSVVAFEPSGTNLWFLRTHIDWNELTNVRILPVAVSDRDGHDQCGGQGSSITFYRLYESTALAEHLANPSLHWGADHELLAVGPKHPATEEVIESLPCFAAP